ncbi:MAG: phosphate signaling complex protein PhoU [Hyphomicrobiales bacterium]|nr:phosphate signaling complex protein PhoU [Hyphomicrobiales bacterium]
MTEHIVRAFEEELVSLGEKIAQMGGIVEGQLAEAVDALKRRDAELAQKVISDDKTADTFEQAIEEQAILMIVRRQPMALDLREIMAAIRVSAELERIGDLAKNVAKRVLAIGTEVQPKRLIHGVEHMSRMAMEQLKNVLDSYSQRDAEKALAVWRRDEEVDSMYTSLFRELLTYMMEDPRNITACTHLLFAAKNIERIGDHTTNIAEMVYYLVHGEALTDQRPKGDETSTTAVPYPVSEE